MRGGRVPEAGAGAAAVPGGPGQRAAAAGNHPRQPSVPGKIDCVGRLTQRGTPDGPAGRGCSGAEQRACVVVGVPPAPPHNARARPGRRKEEEEEEEEEEERCPAVTTALPIYEHTVHRTALRTEVYCEQQWLRLVFLLLIHSLWLVFRDRERERACAVRLLSFKVGSKG